MSNGKKKEKKKLTYEELRDQLASHRDAINVIIGEIDGMKDKSKKVSFEDLEDYEIRIMGYDETSIASTEMTGRARVSC